MSSSPKTSSQSRNTIDNISVTNPTQTKDFSTQETRPRPERSRSVRFDLEETIIPDSKSQVVYPKEGPDGDVPMKDAGEQQEGQKKR